MPSKSPQIICDVAVRADPVGTNLPDLIHGGPERVSAQLMHNLVAFAISGINPRQERQAPTRDFKEALLCLTALLIPVLREGPSGTAERFLDDVLNNMVRGDALTSRFCLFRDSRLIFHDRFLLLWQGGLTDWIQRKLNRMGDKIKG